MGGTGSKKEPIEERDLSGTRKAAVTMRFLREANIGASLTVHKHVGHAMDIAEIRECARSFRGMLKVGAAGAAVKSDTNAAAGGADSNDALHARASAVQAVVLKATGV